MVDLHALLRQKQADIERVRHEIDALTTVLSVLRGADDQPSKGIVPPEPVISSQTVGDSLSKGMADLETYYPFVRRTRPKPTSPSGPVLLPCTSEHQGHGARISSRKAARHPVTAPVYLWRECGEGAMQETRSFTPRS